MSSHFLYALNFEVRANAPPQLHDALTRRAAGQLPEKREMDQLPAIVADHLAAEWAPGDGVYCYQPILRYDIMGGNPQPRAPHPGEPSHHFRMAFTFHDDSFFNGGMYVIYWLLQFAATRGPVATMHQTNGNDAPTIYAKDGDKLFVTDLAFNPDPIWPIGQSEAPDPNAPMVIKRQRTESITEMLEHIAFMADGAFR